MSELQTKIQWEKIAQQKYENMLTKIPLFHREIAKTVVFKKAQENAVARGSDVVEEGDIIQAFFSEVPKAFYSLMIRLMDVVGFSYKKYQPTNKNK